MVICTVEVNEKAPQTIVIGRRGTYNTQEVVFDIGYLIDAYGVGTAVLAVKRSQDSSAYPAVVAQEDSTVTWTVSETDTYYKGAGECELMWYVDGGLAKTIIYPMVVMRDILSTTEEAPDAYQTWVDDLTALGAETLQNAQDAAQSASDAESAKDDAVAAKEAAEAAQRAAETAVTHYPKIEDNYWMVWDSATQQYISTGIQAEGEDGYSPEVTIVSIEGGHRVTITDKDHPQGQSFDVMDGQDGSGSVDDVQINGTSIVSSGVANIPLATASAPGVSYPYSNRGLTINADGQISVTRASDNSIKAGSAQYAPIVPSNQHGAAFYGLAKAAGDVTQAASDNPVGTYTDGAKAAIKDMIGATAGGIGFDDSETYPSGSLGAEVSDQKNAISQLEDDISDLIEDVNSQSIWSQGSVQVGGAGGAIVDNDKAITTTNMITDNVSVALVDNTCKFSIAVYSSSDAWMGFLRYENDEYGLNNYTGTNFTAISYSEIASAYPSCKIRIMVQKVSTSATISPSEYSAVSITKTDITSPYTSNPAMDGTASPGVSGNFARGDHVHPSDTSKADKTSYVTLSGTQVTQIGADNTMYLCGELADLTFNTPAQGQTAIRFRSGTTPTVASFPNVTEWMGGFDPDNLEASKLYEINVLYGVGVAQWT